MITIEWAIAELKKDPMYVNSLQCIDENQRASVEAQTIQSLTNMLGPLLPLINSLHESPEAREEIKKQLIKIFASDSLKL